MIYVDKEIDRHKQILNLEHFVDKSVLLYMRWFGLTEDSYKHKAPLQSTG